MVCCVCVGLEVHIRHEHSRNSTRINTVCLSFTKAEAFSVKVGVQRVDDKGGQTVVEKKPEDVVAVVSCGLKSYFNFICRSGTGTNPLQQDLETFPAVGNGEHIRRDFTFRTDDKAVVLVLCHINTDTNHNDTSGVVFDAV